MFIFIAEYTCLHLTQAISRLPDKRVVGVFVAENDEDDNGDEEEKEEECNKW